jgi:hypothetical protein
VRRALRKYGLNFLLLLEVFLRNCLIIDGYDHSSRNSVDFAGLSTVRYSDYLLHINLSSLVYSHIKHNDYSAINHLREISFTKQRAENEVRSIFSKQNLIYV